ncbi:MAG: thioredoxin family protein [Bdellovibrionaceae bacterium]|nr:thioredoxin family protein [Pseudobdellovibrionaceae bacterium]MDW8190167.1 cytochrome c biogenesis protein CcdA [Pseudobdellovibrionaceae bacterium]
MNLNLKTINKIQISLILSFLWFAIFPLYCAWVTQPLWASSALDGEHPFRWKVEFYPSRMQSYQNGQIKIQMLIEKGYRIYWDSVSFDYEPKSYGFKLGQPRANRVITFFDKNTKKHKEGIEKEVDISLSFEAPEHCCLGDPSLKLIISYQACTDSFCLLPQTREISVPFVWLGTPVTNQLKPDLNTSEKIQTSTESSSATTPSTSFWSFLKNIFSFSPDQIIQLLSDRSIIFVLPIFFLLGFLTSLTPCIYPLIPITLNVLSKQVHGRSRQSRFLLSHVYVLGMATVYAILGVLAAKSGDLFGSHIQSPWVLSIVSIVFLGMALSSFGVFEVTLPSQWHLWLQQLTMGQGGWVAVLFTGMVSGLIAGPCLGPVLIGILTYVAQTQNGVLGFWALFFFALGMGQLLLLIGLSAGIVKWLPRSGEWMNFSKYLLGIIMLAVFYYYLGLLVNERWWWGLLGLGFVLLGGGLKNTLNFFESHKWASGVIWALPRSLLMMGSILMVASILNVTSLLKNRTSNTLLVNKSTADALWMPFSAQKLAEARQLKKPVIVDFTADWCNTCHILEKEVLQNPKFIEATHDFMLLKVDATKLDDHVTEIQKKYGISGLPTLIFFDRKGQWRKDLTVFGYSDVTLQQVLTNLQSLVTHDANR